MQQMQQVQDDQHADQNINEHLDSLQSEVVLLPGANDFFQEFHTWPQP
jgi:hypothetical protein